VKGSHPHKLGGIHGKPAHDVVGHLNHLGHAVTVFSLPAIAGIIIGAAIGWLAIRRMRAAFEWGLLWLIPLGLVVLLIKGGGLAGDAAIGTIGALAGLAFGHLVLAYVLHREDVRAGDDRGHDARERVGPQDVVRRTINFRRIREGRAKELPIGITRRGEIASVRRGDESGSQCLIVGATGAGKSTVLGVLAHEYGEAGHGIVMVEAKRDPNLEAQARRTAARCGRRFVMVSADGSTVWDLFASGGIDDTVAKLLACESYSEPHYESQAIRFLRWVIRGMEGCGTRLTLPRILSLCEPDQLGTQVSKEGGPELNEQVGGFINGLTAQERADVAGLRSRLAVLAESEVGRVWLDPDSNAGPVLDLAEAIRRGDCVYFRLDVERLGIVAQKIGAAIAIELGAISSELHQSPIPTFVGIDELGALDSDHSDRLFTRARGAGFSVAVATHTLADLRVAGDAFEDRLKSTIDTGIVLRCGPDDADAMARLAGQVGDWHTTQRTNGLFSAAETTGTRTRGYRMRIHPSVLQNLERGQCAVIRLDRNDRSKARIARVVPSWERGGGDPPQPTVDAFQIGGGMRPSLSRMSTADRMRPPERSRRME
jgi:hypothetical protein